MARAIDVVQVKAEIAAEKLAVIIENGSVLLKDMQSGEAVKIATLTTPNEPLTLEELREMNEVPVWIQNLEEPAKSQWRLLYWDRGKYLVLQGISVRGYLMEEYGESWLAYRRPPEGEEGDVNRG